MAFTPVPVTVQASAAKTATGQTAGFGAYLVNPQESRNNVINLAANVTVVTGTTPSMTLTVQWSVDGTNWVDADPVDTFTAITAVKNVVKQFTVKAPMARVVYTISGTTPSFTFSLTATGA